MRKALTFLYKIETKWFSSYNHNKMATKHMWNLIANIEPEPVAVIKANNADRSALQEQIDAIKAEQRILLEERANNAIKRLKVQGLMR